MAERSDHAVTRREFITTAAAAGAAAALAPAGVAAAQAGKSKLVHVRSASAMVEGEPNADAVKAMLARGLTELTGEPDLGAALRQFVSPDDVVGIKLNLLGGPSMCNAECLIYALVEGLETAGVPRQNLIVWDRFVPHLIRTGWEIADDPSDLRVIGSEGPGAFGLDDGVFFDCDPPDKRGNRRSKFSKILTQLCTKVINVPLLKDHAMAGVTGALKNIGYGVVSNTARMHRPGNCDPFTADICGHAAARDKFALHLMDALKGQYEGGPGGKPQFQWEHAGLMASADPVALDGLALKLIEEKRAAEGLPSLWDTDRLPKHIKTCAERDLGVLDEAQIDLVAVEL